MNKVVFVEAHFKPLFKEVAVKVPTGETKRGFFGGEKELVRKETQVQQVGWSDTKIDGARLARDVAHAVTALNSDGYEVISTTAIESGSYRYEYKVGKISSSARMVRDTEAVSGDTGYSYGYGYSYTEGVLLIARLAR